MYTLAFREPRSAVYCRPTMSGLEEYDQRYAPEPYGLNNVGSLCYFNSLLQAIAGNTCVVKAALANRDYLARTRTGQAFYDFVWTSVPKMRPPNAKTFSTNIATSNLSYLVYKALVADLRIKRPDFASFGTSQESASECLVHLLDMMDAPPTKNSVTGETEYAKNPISYLFYHRNVTRTWCKTCAKYVSEPRRDSAVHFALFHYDRLVAKPQSSAKFGEIIRQHISPLEGYKCEECGQDNSIRVYRVEMIPEVIVCMFNVYTQRVLRYYPVTIPFKGLNGTRMMYRQTAQIEHFGSVGGGHYIAKGLRSRGKDLQVVSFNDTSCVSQEAFKPTPNVYIVFYHYSGTQDDSVTE